MRAHEITVMQPNIVSDCQLYQLNVWHLAVCHLLQKHADQVGSSQLTAVLGQKLSKDLLIREPAQPLTMNTCQLTRPGTSHINKTNPEAINMAHNIMQKWHKNKLPEKQSTSSQGGAS